MSDWAAKRFWETVTVEGQDDGFVVLLDGRLVKTPAKTTLAVPTHAMAQSIAQEWRDQQDKIDPMTMPVTKTANSALDKVGPQHVEVAELIAAYGENDLLCYRAPGPVELIARQAAVWDPILEWARMNLDAPLSVTQGVMHADQPANSVAILRQLVIAQNPFELAALHDLVSMSGSLVMGLAAQQGAFDINDLWDWSRLDEEWQIEQWGRDDDADATAALKKSAFVHALRFFQLLDA
ncbi:MAG: ATP12 family chaperone protein [Planktomarina sp.]